MPRVKATRYRGGLTFMPPEIRHLLTQGHLYPEEHRALGALGPVMTCLLCHAEVALIATFAPYTAAQMADKKTTLNMLRWGEEIVLLCPCCSMPHCTHTPPVVTRPRDHDGGSAT